MTDPFKSYEILGPLLITPLAAAAWYAYTGGSWPQTAIAMIVPIAYAYIVPGLGTNLLKMWRINSKFCLGGFRWQHGFLFGSSTALIACLMLSLLENVLGVSSTTLAVVTTSAVILAVNWLYDAAAIRRGILEVYNQPWAEGRMPWIIAADYVVWFFGAFALIYVGGVKFSPRWLEVAPAYWIVLSLTAAAALVPTVGYILSSLLRHGHSGCRPSQRPGG